MRLLLGIAHQHLLTGRRHSDDCTTDRCVPGCTLLALETALDAPVTKSDAVAAERRADRADALMRGEIPT